MVASGPERAAIGLLFVACVALALTRPTATDTPWHLATARHAFETGQWPTTNTFSYTHPDYPLYQQYPVYQTMLYLTYLGGGWVGLGLLHCVLWTAIFALWMRWGGSWNWAAILSLGWLLALLGLQRRMILRPDIATMLLLVCLLHSIDLYRGGKRWAACLLVGIQWLMANAHQLFPLGLATQGLFLGHLVVTRLARGRWGLTRADDETPIWPVGLAFLFSAGACLLTPLGIEIVRGPLQTAGSLEHHREHVGEFRPLTADGYSTTLVALAAILVAGALWRARRDWSPFELGLVVMGLALAAAAQRGAAFFVLLALGVFARTLGRAVASESMPGIGNWRLVRAGLTIAGCLVLIHWRWVAPTRVLGGTQPGFGQALGDYPHHGIAFLKEHPPPGRGLNLSWYAGNALVWELYPKQPVFVDPRFEAYPRSFLLAAIAAQDDPAALERLLDEYDPGWLVIELRKPGPRRRLAELLASGAWSLVHVDTIWAIVVRVGPDTDHYLEGKRLSPAAIEPPGLLVDEPDLCVLQLLRMADLLFDLHEPQRGRAFFESARDRAAGIAERQADIDEFLARRAGQLEGRLARATSGAF